MEENIINEELGGMANYGERIVNRILGDGDDEVTQEIKDLLN